MISDFLFTEVNIKKEMNSITFFIILILLSHTHPKLSETSDHSRRSLHFNGQELLTIFAC